MLTLSSSRLFFTLLILLTAIERLFEVKLSNRNAKWSFEQNGIEIGKEHYPYMVVLHTGFLVACVAEAWLMERYIPVGWAIIGFFAAISCQMFRWWCITSLGKQWNTRVILVPNAKRIVKGPYQYFSHPNYIIVAIEGIVLPLIHKAWFSAIGFTLLNAGLMWVRIRCEERALQQFLTSGKS